MGTDPFFAGEGDIGAARALAGLRPEQAETVPLSGRQERLFADSSLPSYHHATVSLLSRRILDFLDGIR